MWGCFGGGQIAGRNYPPTNKNTLIRALTEEWDKLPQQLLDNVVQRIILDRIVILLRLSGERNEAQGPSPVGPSLKTSLLVILNHIEVTRTTPELKPSSPSFLTTATGGL
ncbi:hypothetical protein TNCV_2264731 [Trichonephila clavipes]|nr:hypothetical protein TNCV_2264731 [Trichonephila clavipes]